MTIEQRAEQIYRGNTIEEEAYKNGWADGVEKACEWLEAHSIDYVGYDGITDFRTLYHDFRKAMEE